LRLLVAKVADLKIWGIFSVLYMYHVLIEFREHMMRRLD